ncbi:high mobility group box domain-containing protein [Dimargaris cristalligena]|uniref:High mobility group box domain-containing protein n=1 Tax=Dimargaris cristalligena TaxID=215637 RepID=A0A4P9ZVB4_9FUNG|nr:high mobility group box domain-containing protein [Dimargaris cristalligena]|eukprot:RKP37218.1 high mobility group box domain-containing protein [Dimargaris cristalligena]
MDEAGGGSSQSASTQLGMAPEGSDPDAELADPAKKRRPRRPKDPNAPKKPQNAYFRYRDQELGRMKTDNETETITDLTRRISENWKNLSTKDKQPFFDQYNREIDVYRVIYKEYRLAMKARAEALGETPDPSLLDPPVINPADPNDPVQLDEEDEQEVHLLLDSDPVENA